MRIYVAIMGHNWDQLKKIIMTYDFVTPLERWELVQPDPCKTPLVCTDNIRLISEIDHTWCRWRLSRGEESVGNLSLRGQALDSICLSSFES